MFEGEEYRSYIPSPLVVWVAVAGCYSSQGVEGVYSSAEAGMAANPVPAKPRTKTANPGWHQDGHGDWTNGLDWEEAMTLERFEVDRGYSAPLALKSAEGQPKS